MSTIRAAMLATLLLAAPALAGACPVCNPGLDDPAQFGFLMGTIFLSTLPLALVGSLVFWIRRRLRQIEAEEASGVIRLSERRASRATPSGSPHPAAR